MGLKKQIIQFKDGEQVAVYDSATDAANAIESTKSNISKCCLGKLKQVKGFIFKYSGEFTNQQKNDGGYKCPYCEKRFETYNGLCKHIFRYKEHGDSITQEQLLTDYKYGGIRPKCKCGCGEYTEIRYDGGVHFSDYMRGHHSRIHNNWGHNEQAKIHSAETRRRQYKNGERIQWNKGKSWEETYTEDKIKVLMKNYSKKERNKKISVKLKNVPKSEEHKEKLKIKFNTKEYRKRSSELMYQRLTNGSFSLSSKKENEFIEYCIKPLGIDYDTQYYLKDIHHYCDVYIPSKNMIIEFQGDYWHGNPNKYSNDELSEYQKKKVTKDNELREYCSKNGINLIEIWESDYDKDSSGVKTLLEEQLKQK